MRKISYYGIVLTPSFRVFNALIGHIPKGCEYTSGGINIKI